MKNRNLFEKSLFGLIAVICLMATAPAIFSQTLSSPKTEKLLNGLKVLMWSDQKADIVAIKLRIHSGSAFDPQGKEGVMQMLADSIFPNDASREFFREDLGGDLEVEANYDYIQINASSRPDGFLTMLETLATAVSNPAVDKESAAKLRTALLARVSILEADPAYVADQAAASRLFGTFPYGRPQMGSTASLQKVDFADLINAKERFLSADNATIALSGKFDRALAYRAIRRYFGSWLKSDKKVPMTFRQPDSPAPGVLSVASPKPDIALVRYALRGVARSDKDLAAPMVFAAVLERRLRTQLTSGRSAGAFVRVDAYALPGHIMIGFPAATDENGQIVGKVMGETVSESEFQAGKAAFKTEWSRKQPATFWLDADTYKIASPEAYARIADTVTLADVAVFAEKARRQPLASVLMTSHSTAN